MSFTLVHAPEKLKVLKMILNGQRKSWYSRQYHHTFSIINPPKNNRSQFAKEMTRLFPKVVWKGLELAWGRTVLFKKQTFVAVVDVPEEEPLIAFRNGWDCGKYNFIIYCKNKIYHRQNVEGTVELIQILTDGNNLLPLYMGSTIPENIKIVESRLKGYD